MSKYLDERFDDSFGISIPAVDKVFEWLKTTGVTIEKPPPVKRPTFSQKRKFRDRGDLIIHHGSQRFEIDVKYVVKARFHSIQSFYRQGVVGSADAIDSKPLPFAYAMVNGNMTHIAVTNHMDKRDWIRDAKRGSRNGMWEDQYYIPRSFWTVYDMRKIYDISFTNQSPVRQRIIPECAWEGPSQDRGVQTIPPGHDATVTGRNNMESAVINSDNGRTLKRSTGSRQHSETDPRLPAGEIPVQRQQSLFSLPGKGDRTKDQRVHRDPH